MVRGQSAMEFLVTYGWAFLVILVMIGALAYFGVIDTSRFLPEKAVVDQGFVVVDQYLSKWDSNVYQCEVSVLFKNNFGEPIRIVPNGTRVTCENCRYNSDPLFRNNCYHWRTKDGLFDNGWGTEVVIGQDWEFALECNSGAVYYVDFPSIGQREKIQIEITYQFVDGKFNHTATAEIIAPVQEQKCGMRRCLYPEGDPTGDTTC